METNAEESYYHKPDSESSTFYIKTKYQNEACFITY